MPEIVIGARTIRYDVRRSARAGRKRIEITPGKMQVIVPEGATSKDVERFVQSKRRWLHDKSQEIQEEVDRLHADTPRGYHSGAKVLFRGRYLTLRVRSGDVNRPSLTYRTAFHVTVPREVSEADREGIVRGLLDEWLTERLLDDAREIVRRRGKPHGLEPRGIQVKDQRTLWGSCGRDRVIRLDRKLIRLPRPIFEYVMVHELCHLEHRDHSPRFWATLGRLLPDYEERKAWLEDHEVLLG